MIESTFTDVFPVFVIVTWSVAVDPTFTFPKLRLLVLSERVAEVDVPEPLIEIFRLALLAVLRTVNVPVLFPELCGVNFAVNVNELPELITVPEYSPE